MQTLNFPPVHEGDLRIEATPQGSAIAVKFAGTADMRAQKPLDSVLPALHAEITRLGVGEVIVDFFSLEFMNSSCFKSFLTWVGTVQALAPERQYRLRFLSNASVHWQRRSLQALRCFATELIKIES